MAISIKNIIKIDTIKEKITIFTLFLAYVLKIKNRPNLYNIMYLYESYFRSFQGNII